MVWKAGDQDFGCMRFLGSPIFFASWALAWQEQGQSRSSKVKDRAETSIPGSKGNTIKKSHTNWKLDKGNIREDF